MFVNFVPSKIKKLRNIFLFSPCFNYFFYFRLQQQVANDENELNKQNILNQEENKIEKLGMFVPPLNLVDQNSAKNPLDMNQNQNDEPEQDTSAKNIFDFFKNAVNNQQNIQNNSNNLETAQKTENFDGNIHLKN